MMKATTISPLMQKTFTTGTPFKKQDAGAMTAFIQEADKDVDHIIVNLPAVFPVNYEVEETPVGAIDDQVIQAWSTSLSASRDKFITANSTRGSRCTSLQTPGLFAAFLLVGKKQTS